MCMKVMVLDDSDHMVQFLTGLLENVGHTVTAASDWSTVSTVMRSGIDAAIVDLHMPGLSGDQVVGPLKHYYPGTVVVMLSGEDEDVVASAATHCKADAWLLKKNIRELPSLLERLAPSG